MDLREEALVVLPMTRPVAVPSSAPVPAPIAVFESFCSPV
jgi:hypothetical protein